VLFAPADISANLQSNVYYDGVVLGQLTFISTPLAIISGLTTFYPNPIATDGLFQNPNIDPLRYVFFATPLATPRYYFTVVLGNSSINSLNGPSQGQVLLDVATGSVYLNQTDAKNLAGLQLVFLDSVLTVERGVAIQLYRSGANSSGVEQTPDFTEKYLVTDQVIQSGIGGSPFVTLPTVPIVDSTLAFSVEPNTSGGTFVGALRDNTNPAFQAVGYILNLDTKQVSFSSRKTVTQILVTAQPSIKLTDAAIYGQGFEVTRTIGTNPPQSLTPGVDFAFNANSGVLDFLTPVGEDDPRNILNIAGTVTLPNMFEAGSSLFSPSNVGMFLLVSEGLNVNLYAITGVPNAKTLEVSPNFVVAGATQADVRASREIIADRFFTSFTPPLRKLTVSSASSINGTYTALTQAQFNIFINTGQINLTTPSLPGTVYKISYIWNQSPDNGVTVTPTPVTEFAAFKIRQETATVVPNSNIIHFNPSGNTVQTNQTITLYIDGVTQDPSSYNFVAPGTLSYNQILQTSNVVIVDYYVAESPGGNTNFTLVNSPVSVDYPQIVAGSASSTFNGNQTALLQRGGAFLVNTIDIVMMGDVSYDATTDTTTVLFNLAPCNYNNGPVGSAPTPVQISAPIVGVNAPLYMVTETNSVDLLANNTNVVSINGQVNYPQGTIVLIDGDPYLVQSSVYTASTNITSVTLADNALRNYIISTLQHTIRPVLQAGTTFQTSQSATIAFPFTLVNSGTTPAVLRPGVDYTVADGGTVKLTTAVGYGSVLNALYTARNPQAAGTTFVFNYAYAIAPSTTNGILGQNLAETYNLYSPDTFFFDAETIVSFIPVVITTIQQAASQGSAGSGPNIQSQSAPQTKDQGSPSLYWLEVHLGNEDIVIQRLLFFYNTLINNYEDILSDLDGRVVGGSSGKFRYDGNSIVVTTYAEISNDIDDECVLYYNTFLTGFITFESVPVYGFMYQPNNLSRIYPTADPFVTVALNNNNVPIFDFGNTIGSTNITKLTSVSTLVTSRAVSPVVSAFASGTGTIATITTNGNASQLVPPFLAGQTVQLNNPDGSPNGSTGTVSAVTGPDVNGNFLLGIAGVAVSMLGGGVVQVIGSSGHYYTPGRDFNVNNDEGTFTSNYLGLPSPPFPGVIHISGNELVDTSVTFVNQDSTPRRIPVLDGSTLSDNGRPAVPPVSRVGELRFLSSESSGLQYVGNATVVGALMTTTGGLFPQPIIGQSGVAASISYLAGTGAAISSFNDPLLTVTGLADMNPSLVGGSLVLTGAANPSNNGIFIIAAYVSPNSVQITNVNGVAPDAGPLTWQVTATGTLAATGAFASPLLTITGLYNISAGLVGSSITISGSSNAGNNGTFTIAAILSPTPIGGQSGSSATITAAGGGTVTFGGLNGMTVNSVGHFLVITGAATAANNGTFLIVSFVDAHTVNVSNSNGVFPDANSGSIGWVEASDSIQVNNPSGVGGDNGPLMWAIAPGGILVTGLTGINSNDVGSSILISNAASAPNNGGFVIAAFINATTVVIINPAGVAPDGNNGSLQWSVASADTIIFINGPNAGQSRTAIAIGVGTITVSTPWTHNDLIGSDYYVVEPTGDIFAAIQGELDVLSNNTGLVSISGSSASISFFSGTNTISGLSGITPEMIGRTIAIINATTAANNGSFTILTVPNSTTVTVANASGATDPNNGFIEWVISIIIPPALIAEVDSEILAINTAMASYGQTSASGIGTPTSATVFSDPTADFATAQPPITATSLLYIPSGPNQGLYQVASATDTTITTTPGNPYPASFPSIGTSSPYVVMQPWSFLSNQEFAFATAFLQAAQAFYSSTLAWSTTVTASGVAARQAAIAARQAAVAAFVTTLEGLLGSTDNLYNIRYLWIQQRTDKSQGLLIQEVQAMTQRLINTQSLIAAQQKILIANSLLNALG